MTTSGSDRAGAAARRLFVTLWTVLVLAKLYLASGLDLFGDEAFYWQQAQRLAPAYADHPPLTALLIHAGTLALGDTHLGVRALFLATGSALPWLVFWLALPIIGPASGYRAATLTLALPLAASLGIAALPDVPMLFFTLLAVGAFERAVRTDLRRYWLLFGSALACGLMTHYRFVVLPAALLLYLVGTSAGRGQWRRTGLWLGGGIALTGLVPVLIFNWRERFAPLRYQFGERHPWSFHADGLLHVGEQAIATSPLLYGFLVAALLAGCRPGELKRGGAASLLALCGAVPVAGFALLAPFADGKHFTLHWPLSGYLLLTPLAVTLLERWWQEGGWRRVLAAAAPAVGLAGVAGMLAYYGWVANLEQFYRLVPPGQARSDMAGWSALADATRSVWRDVTRADPARAPDLLLADRYYTAAQLDFELAGQYVVGHLDEYKVHGHGRAWQYALWEVDEAGIRTHHAGRSALVVVDESKARYGFKRYARIRALCGLFDRMVLVDSVDLFGGAQRYRFYLGLGLREPGDGSIPESGLPVGEEFKPFLPLPADCPVPSFGDMGQVTDGTRLTGVAELKGWAFNNTAPVERVDLLLDRKPVAVAAYGQPWSPLLRSEFWEGGVSSPDAPNVGFRVHWNTAGFAKGRHELALQVTTRTGRIDRLVAREIWID